ncbi:MAG: type III pantothenate kinase [Candidatus Omnitrophota bacterium]
MLLAIDIGNTNISFGAFDSKRLVKRFDIPTYGYSLRSLKKSLGRIEMEDCIICSVVPKVSRILKADLKKLLGKRACVVGEDVKVPIKNLYRKPRQVGSDRLVNAYAGIVLYGAPLIIVDFGTAVTFDVISKRREYLGGMILPGMGISLDALTERTALLPEVKLNKPAELIGRDTKSSMLSGIVYGFASLAENLTKRIKEKIGKDAKVVATGGDVGIIGRYFKGIDKIDKNLTLKGLILVLTIPRSTR